MIAMGMLGSQDIVLRRTATIFFRSVDSEKDSHARIVFLTEPLYTRGFSNVYHKKIP